MDGLQNWLSSSDVFSPPGFRGSSVDDGRGAASTKVGLGWLVGGKFVKVESSVLASPEFAVMRGLSDWLLLIQLATPLGGAVIGGMESVNGRVAGVDDS